MTCATREVRHISTPIARAPADVYDFASKPANLPRWAGGLSASISLIDGQWVAESDLGRVTVEFVPNNPHGVLDHTVTLPDGMTFLNCMRVIPNGDGAEVVFHLVRAEGTGREAFDAETEAVERDLATLKALLER